MNEKQASTLTDNASVNSLPLPPVIWEFNINTLEEMQSLGAHFCRYLDRGDIVCLIGDLGAGKTSFARALIRCFVGNPTLEVPSPTYTLVQTYERADYDLWHFDLYRLEHARDVWALGIEEALERDVCVIEWPQRIAKLLSGTEFYIQIEHIENGAKEGIENENARHVTFYGPRSWFERTGLWEHGFLQPYKKTNKQKKMK